MKSTETVFLPGASGTMGYEAFKELWSRRLNEDGSIKYRIVLLQRPSKKNKKLFKPYEKEAGLNPISGKGVVENEQLRIIWGNATDKDCIWEACDGVDWVLNAMALIPPISDFKPDLVRRVNHEATKEIIKAIESQPNGADRIKYIYVGSISQTGDRLPPIHHARVGDPIKACIFDTYTITKNESERFVMESDLKYWASLRVTFIMAQDVMDMQGSYMFYQPLGAYME